MDRFVVHPVSRNVEVRVTREMPALERRLDSRVDAAWVMAAARVEAAGGEPIFNGRVFSIDTITPDRITGHLTEYRRLVAQMEDHTLYPELGIRSLAACGVLRCTGGIVIGRRPAGAIYQPGMWQLCPAGSVDGGACRPDGTMDYRAQLLTEIREELGLEAEAIGEVTPLCVVEHPGSHVSDLGMAVSTPLDAARVLEAHRKHGNREYAPLRIVPVPELPAFIDWAGTLLVPPAAIFLARAGFL
jgi:hypothetical protein